MDLLGRIALIMVLLIGSSAGLGFAQAQSALPKPCGGEERAIVEFSLERYQKTFTSPEHEDFRQAIDVEALTSDAAVGVVDEPRLCSRLIRAALDVMNTRVAPPEDPNNRMRRNHISYKILRLGPYHLVVISPPDDPNVSFMGYASTGLVFDVETREFISWFLT